MAEVKTKQNTASVKDFLMSVEDEGKRRDALELLKIFTEITGEEAKMWGGSIVGFGKYHYKSERSSQEADWMLTGFSPRKQNLTLYVISGFDAQQQHLENLGKHKTSVGCLYIKRLSDVDLEVLKKIIKSGYESMKKLHKI